MDDALKSAASIIILVIAVAYFTAEGSNYAFNQQAATSTPIIIRDIVSKDQHHLYGKILVHSSCEEVTISTQNLENNNYQLNFSTWPEPDVQCTNEPSERVFDTVIFAPSVGVQFSATLDKVPVPVVLYPILNDQILN